MTGSPEEELLKLSPLHDFGMFPESTDGAFQENGGAERGGVLRVESVGEGLGPAIGKRDRTDRKRLKEERLQMGRKKGGVRA